MSTDLTKAIAGLLNVVVILCPLIATMFGVVYFYASREFIELLLARPMKRSQIFMGLYIGLGASLSVSFLLGVGIPLALFGILVSTEAFNFLFLILSGVLLTLIFSAISFLVALRYNDRIKGFSYAIFIWLFWAVIYDGVFMLGLVYFQDYPLEKFALVASLLNPIDLSRILVLLKLDISALMGYTGAVFKNFFGNGSGTFYSILMLLVWLALPILGIIVRANRRDF
jgi:Cu-processing system permease protein